MAYISYGISMVRVGSRSFVLPLFLFVLSTLSGIPVWGQKAPGKVPPPDTVQVDSISAGAVTSQGLADTIVARAQTVRQTEVHALLPYIFFERDSASIPSRYVRIEPRALRDFREETIERGNTLNVYYQLLNVLGSRLRVNRRATLTITGYIGQFESDSSLGVRRAAAVRDYLRDVWRIREDRMAIAGGGLPLNPSLSEVDTLEGDLENQRVEFSSNDLVLLAPVRLPDTLLLQPAGVIRLIAPPDRPDSVTMLESWQVNVKIGDSVVTRAVAGYGAPPQQIEFRLEQRPDLARHGPVEITSELVILDSLFEKRRELQAKPVWFVEEGGYQVERNVENGKYVDRYNLLLYSFDSSGVFDFSRQATAVLREKITPESTVTIIGHTDRIGLPPYNKKLSQQRAEVAAGLLGLSDAKVVGMGESELLYDNEFPEGRYHSRTVTVVIETPIKVPETSSTVSSTPSGTATGMIEGTSVAVPAPEKKEQGATDDTTPTPTETPAVEQRKRDRTDVPTSVTLPVPE